MCVVSDQSSIELILVTVQFPKLPSSCLKTRRTLCEMSMDSLQHLLTRTLRWRYK